jgi:acyl-coenzyme A thioesterase PaaI-like protein
VTALPPNTERLEVTRQRHHPRCVVCSSQHPGGLRISYTACPDGGVAAVVPCPRAWEGYPERVHGGVIASLIDGAMTHCLFAEGIAAVTAELQVRYRHPLILASRAEVTARISRRSPPLFILSAQVEQQGQVRATAVGKFMIEDNAFRDVWQGS